MTNAAAIVRTSNRGSINGAVAIAPGRRLRHRLWGEDWLASGLNLYKLHHLSCGRDTHLQVPVPRTLLSPKLIDDLILAPDAPQRC